MAAAAIRANSGLTVTQNRRTCGCTAQIELNAWSFPDEVLNPANAMKESKVHYKRKYLDDVDSIHSKKCEKEENPLRTQWMSFVLG